MNESCGSEDSSSRRSKVMGRSAPRGYDPRDSLGPYYNDAHRRPFRRRGGFARWYGVHGRSGEVMQMLRRDRLPDALAASMWSINGAAKILGCSWHTVYSDLRAIENTPTRYESDPAFRRWVWRERKKIEILRLRKRGYSFREIAERTGVPLATCHRWWHDEMAS